MVVLDERDPLALVECEPFSGIRRYRRIVFHIYARV
jgi:hypothetical protein